MSSNMLDLQAACEAPAISSSPSSTVDADSQVNASEAEREMENHILEGLPPFKLETQVAILAAALLYMRHRTH